MTQDAYGNRYKVSGPAIFKFEKGYVKPSLKLWMRIAADANLPPASAVRIWMKESLPEKYREYVELQGAVAEKGPMRPSPRPAKHGDYASCAGRKEILRKSAGDQGFPESLRSFLSDDEMWALYCPTGTEINAILDIFGPLGRGSKSLYREALYVVRLFSS